MVHATHCSGRERKAIAASGAVVGLCPATEANLGDGIFPISRFVADGGSWGIGTDMNHAISLIEELRILEVGQRLHLQRRNILANPASEATAHPGRRLLDLAWAGGARSVGHPAGSIESGRRADLVVLDSQSSSLMEHGPETILDAWIFSATVNPVRDVMVAGRWVVRDGAHRHRDRVLRQFRKAIRRIWGEA
jgi:formimidoylglutamate deiminase